MTTIIPSSNILMELQQIQRNLFNDFNCVPAPFPLLITYLHKEKPMRPTRKTILNDFPEKIFLTDYFLNSNNLLLKINEEIPLIFDKSLNLNLSNVNRGFIISTKGNIDKIEPNILPELKNTSVKNYSLITLEVECISNDPFWLNMSWNQLWEVKKGKIKI